MQVTMVPVGKLKAAEDNIRAELDEAKIAELAASIKSVGVLEPLLVDENGLLVVCGSRRLAAAKKAGLKEVPVTLGSYSAEQRLTVMAIENLQRQSLSPLEEAHVYERLRGLGLATRAIAERVGVSQSWVVKRLSLLKLPEEAQEAVGTGTLEIRQATELVKVADDPKLVAKLVKKAATGKTVDLDVQQELDARSRAKQAKAKEKELAAAGEKTILPIADEWYTPVPPKGAKLVTDGFAVGAIKMDPAAHAKLPCHAAGVHPHTAQLLELCTDPGKHPDPEAKRQAEEKKRHDERIARQERERREHEHRVAFLKTAAVKPSKETVLEVCWLALAGDAGYAYTDGTLALELLGLEDPEGEDEEQTDVEARLSELASKPAGKLRVTFAFAIDRIYGLGNLAEVLQLLGYEWKEEEEEESAEAPVEKAAA